MTSKGKVISWMLNVPLQLGIGMYLTLQGIVSICVGLLHFQRVNSTCPLLDYELSLSQRDQGRIPTDNYQCKHHSHFSTPFHTLFFTIHFVPFNSILLHCILFYLVSINLVRICFISFLTRSFHFSKMWSISFLSSLWMFFPLIIPFLSIIFYSTLFTLISSM